MKRILAALSCVFTFALRRGYIATHPFHRLERDERPSPLRSDQRVLTRAELAHLFAACPHRYRPLLATGVYTGMRLSEVLALSRDLRHTFASHLIVDIRLDVVQVSRMLGHARTSMTLDTYTHLFDEARHGADVRAELARSDFAQLLAGAAGTRLEAGEHPRSTRAVLLRPRPRSTRRRRRCGQRSLSAQPLYLTKT